MLALFVDACNQGKTEWQRFKQWTAYTNRVPWIVNNDLKLVRCWSKTMYSARKIPKKTLFNYNDYPIKLFTGRYLHTQLSRWTTGNYQKNISIFTRVNWKFSYFVVLPNLFGKYNLTADQQYTYIYLNQLETLPTLNRLFIRRNKVSRCKLELAAAIEVDLLFSKKNEGEMRLSIDRRW